MSKPPTQSPREPARAASAFPQPGSPHTVHPALRPAVPVLPPAHDVARVVGVRVLAPEYVVADAGPYIASARLVDGLDVTVEAGAGSVEAICELESGQLISLRFKSAKSGHRLDKALLRGFEILAFLLSRPSKGGTAVASARAEVRACSCAGSVAPDAAVNFSAGESAS